MDEMGDVLGHLEFMVLLAVIQLGDGAYGVPIGRVVEDATERELALASIYASLRQLETKGFITSRMEGPTPERGGRAKRYFRASARGMRAARQMRRSLVSLWQELPDMK